MKINNEIYQNCYNYEGFELNVYGIDFFDNNVGIDRVENHDIEELVANIFAYNPLKNKDVIILSSHDFVKEIKSSKLRVLLIEQIYKNITSEYLLETYKEHGSCISLKRIVEELKELIIVKDNEEYNQMEKDFYEEYSLLRFHDAEEYNQMEKRLNEKRLNDEHVKTMNIDSFLTYCRIHFNMTNREFLEFCILNKELSPCKRLWLKIIGNIYPYTRMKIEDFK